MKNGEKEKSKRQPILFGEKDGIRKEIEWHLIEASNLHSKLEPLDNRGFIGGTDKSGNCICILFRGDAEDVFDIKEFLDKKDANEE